MNIIQKIIILSISLILHPVAAHAEWQNAVQNPQMQIAPQDGFSIPKAELRVTKDKLAVSYHLKPWLNLYDAHIHFDILPYAWFGDAVFFLDRSFSDLRVAVNGKVANIAYEYVATIKNKDITNELLENNINPTLLNNVSNWIEDSEVNKLKYSSLLKSGYMTYVHGDRYIPNWWVHPYYWFSEHFTKDEVVEISYSHSLYFGADYFAVPELKKDKKSIVNALFSCDEQKIQDVFSKINVADKDYCKITQTHIPFLNISKYTPINNLLIHIEKLSDEKAVYVLRLGDGRTYIFEEKQDIILQDCYPQEDVWLVIFSKQ